MKYYLSLFIFITIIISSSCTRIIESEEVKKEITNVIKIYYTSQEQEDPEALSSLFAKDSTIIAYFINQKQPVIGWENIRDYFIEEFNRYDDIKTWRKNEVIHVSQLNNVAWISSVNHSEMSEEGKVISLNYYFTAILEKIGGKWQFVLVHSSNFNNNLTSAINDTHHVTIDSQIPLKSKKMTGDQQLKIELEKKSPQESKIDTIEIVPQQEIQQKDSTLSSDSLKSVI